MELWLMYPLVIISFHDMDNLLVYSPHKIKSVLQIEYNGKDKKT